MLITPPVAVILILSAPSLYLCLTAFLASETLLITPSKGPGSPCIDFFQPFVGSAWPPVVPIPFPAVKILGPITFPFSIAFLNDIFTPDPPKSLTVVNPDINVIFAYSSELKARSASFAVNSFKYF